MGGGDLVGSQSVKFYVGAWCINLWLSERREREIKGREEYNNVATLYVNTILPVCTVLPHMNITRTSVYS